MTTAESKTGKDTAPHSEQELTAEIERTRADLGATVEALAAKTDFKARIRTAMSRIALMFRVGTVKAKLQSRASRTAQGAGATVSKAVPDPVQQAAHRAAETARRRRGPLAMAAGAAAIGSVAAVIARWRRR
jgi:Protein of unknown function (DUF3618)